MKHLVPLIVVGVHRDITTTTYPHVPAHEIPVLQSIHGETNVYEGDPSGQNAALDPSTEYDRLTRKYGEDAVRDAYGVSAAGDIRRAVIDASVGTVEEDNGGIVLEGPDSKPAKVQAVSAADEPDAAGKPGQNWSKAQLAEYASVHGIDVAEDATKAQLLDAIKAAA